MTKSKPTPRYYLGETLRLTQNCELGQTDERCVVIECDAKYMTLVFPNRAPGLRNVWTGADYRFLTPALGAKP